MGIREPFTLHFEDSGKWCSLPEWAEYFISIGRQHALTPPADSRLVTAIVVPTRAFSAAFVGMGMVISEASLRDPATETAHFEKLFDLPPGTPVIFRPEKGKTLKGVILTPEECRGKIWVKVQVQSNDGGGLTCFIDEPHALQVQPVGGHPWKLPKDPGNSNIRFANMFVDRLLGEDDPVHLGLHSKLVCALVGRRNTLEEEIKRTPLSVLVNGERYAEGQLQDILRINKFVTAKQSHRSALVTTGANSPPDDVINGVEIGIVFDGAVGFLKWGSLWQCQHQVIILDRTDHYFVDAISAINTRFSQNELTGGGVMPDIEVPPGAEILTFREALL